MRSITILLLLVICAVSTDVNAQKKPKVSTAMKAMKGGDFATAVAEINRASEFDKLKDDPKTWWSRAQIFVTADTSGAGVDNALKEALTSMDKAKELSNDDVSKLFVTGANGFPVPFDEYRNNYWAYYFNSGATAYGDEDYQSAVAEFEKAQMITPEDTNAYINAGLAAHNDQAWDAAKRNYQGAIDNGVQSKDIYSLYVSILNSEESTREKALEIIRTAREIYPTDNELARSEINVLIQLGKADEARENLAKQIEAEPDNAVLHFTLGVMLEETGDKEGAKAAYRNALKADPNDFNSNFNIGVMLINEATDIIKERNNLGISDADLKKADEMDPLIDEKLEEAMPQWEKVHQLEPEDITALETLRYIYSQLKLMDQAEAIQDKIDALGEG
ncbi:MAG: tetratricopeptide repeat protein [Cytophagales bacterium]|nr:tetratricopeptide repeat protein [Cytophagales bacterium]